MKPYYPPYGQSPQGLAVPTAPSSQNPDVNAGGQAQPLASTQAAGIALSDHEKRQLIQLLLILLLRSYNCQRRELHVKVTWHCKVPHCKRMKEVLKHMMSCQVSSSLRIYRLRQSYFLDHVKITLCLLSGCKL